MHINHCVFSFLSCLLAYCYGVWFIHLPAYVRSHHNIAKALHNAYEVSQTCISLYTVLYVCDVTLQCASTPGKLTSLPDHGGNRTRDLWDKSSRFELVIFWN